MIKWTEIVLGDNNHMTQKQSYIRRTYPTRTIALTGTTFYTIPVSTTISSKGWYYHNDSGPALIIQGENELKKSYWWYGKRAIGESQWKSPLWRRKIEIERFL